MDISRDELIDICDRAIVPEDRWRDRDTDRAQQGVGRALVYLRAGVPYKVITEGALATDEKTIWIEFYPKDFGYFDHRETRGCEVIYLPTLQRLAEADGGDWY